jgi:hypothetical protein
MKVTKAHPSQSNQISTSQITIETPFQKRTTTPPSPPPSKRPKFATNTPSSPEVKTPDAPTIPVDPRQSGGSEESNKVEEYSKDLIRAFLNDVRFFLAPLFNTLHWVQSISKPRIEPST